MAYEIRDNSGTLFKNANRTKDTQPHARGDAMIGGVLYEVSAWTKDGAKGKFQSLSFKVKEERQERPQRQEPPRTSYDDRDDPRTARRGYEDDLPF